MKLRHRIGALCLALAMAFGASGCVGREAGEMFALPEPPEDYRNLNTKLSEIRTSIGGESIAPQSGSNSQTVQLQDLDGDGQLESAVAFFRVPGAERPLRIYVFRLQEDGSYAVSTIIEGVGSAINSVNYENVGGDARKEVVVSWQISGDDHTLGVYSLDDKEGIELLWVDRYSRFLLAELDRDNQRELVVLTLQNGEEGARADYYDYDGAALALKSTAALSAGVNEIKAVCSGNLQGGIPAVFVTSAFPDTADQVVDILCCKDAVLSNITLDPVTRRSEKTIRSYTAVSGRDIDRDGVMEIPLPVMVPKALGDTDDFWLLEWRQFDDQGQPDHVMTTFHNVTDGWYFDVPNGWADRITISRKDTISAGERAVAFSLWQGDDQPAKTFLVIYMLTGTNQQSRALLGNRQTIISTSSAIYAYELMPEVWDTGLSGEDVIQRFHIISTEWSADN